MLRKNNLVQVLTERIETCQSSGINVKAWCKDNNVSTGQYYYWIKKLNNNIASEVTENISVEWEELALASQ